MELTASTKGQCIQLLISTLFLNFSRLIVYIFARLGGLNLNIIQLVLLNILLNLSRGLNSKILFIRIVWAILL